MGGEVRYRLVGGGGALRVDRQGRVFLWRRLDRDARGGGGGGGELAVVVEAVDGGTPPLSATATLAVTVRDANDSPPRIGEAGKWIN